MQFYKVSSPYQSDEERVRLFDLIYLTPHMVHQALPGTVRGRSWIKYSITPGQNLRIEIPNEGDDLTILRDKTRSWWGQTGISYRYEKIPVKPGDYHKRVFRPLIKHNRSNFLFESSIITISNGGLYDFFPYSEHTLISSLQQLEILKHLLLKVFLTISPTRRNYAAFGHELRNLLMLSSTEVEAQFKGILIANGYKKKAPFNTIDYFKLCDVLKLKEYEISFPQFPEIGRVLPFYSWKSPGESQSLWWYSNYNSVKHDREMELHRATLFSAINAVAGVCILIIAQYGYNIPFWKDFIGSFFEIASAPKWKLEDCYLPPFSDTEWKPVKMFS